MLIKLDPPLDPRLLLAGPRPLAAFPFGRPGLSLHFSGRYALLAGLRALGLPEGSEVLVPAYNCGTEVEPVLRAGLRVRLYRVRRDLTCDLDHLAELVRRPEVRALLLTHYLGLPQPAVAEVAALCREWGVALIEDCAHAFLSDLGGRPLGSWGDAAVFSLVKALPLPDGGAVVFREGLPEGGLGAQVEPPAAVIQHLAARVLRHNRAGEGRFQDFGARLLERTLAARRGLCRLAWTAKPGRAGLGLADPRSLAFRPELAAWRMSGLSRAILSRLELAAVKAARRRNFQRLLDHFRERHPGCLVTPELPEGACPLLFPVRLRRPPELFVRSLAGWGVESWPWWGEFHPALPWAEFPEAGTLKRRLLALPVHQGLGEEETACLCSAFEAAWRLLA